MEYSYAAHFRTNRTLNVLYITTTPAHWANISFFKPQLPGVYAAPATGFSAQGLIKHTIHLYPHRYPFTPGWREANVVKHLAQGRKHRSHRRDSNPHSEDSATEHESAP